MSEEIDPGSFMVSNCLKTKAEAIKLCASHMAGFAAQRGAMWGIVVDVDEDALQYQRLRRLLDKLTDGLI